MHPNRGGRAVLAATLALARTRQPYVIWGSEPMNGGNFLYLWATAWARRRHNGETWLVRYKPRMAPWLEEFPALRDLTVREADITWRQARTVEWGQQAGQDWQFSDIETFAREYLLSSGALQQRLHVVDRKAVVVNVRRGDYYSIPANRKNYGFDIRGYVQAAIARVPERDRLRIVLVSDDVPWCRENLGFLESHGDVQSLPGPHEMFRDFAQIVGGRHLILANSTFSFWGAYAADALPLGERPLSIQVPAIHNRLYDHIRSILLPPHWMALADDEYLSC